MDSFHANLLFLQCQRFSVSPQPFDCAIRLKVSEQKEFILFAHSHLLAAKCLRFRSLLGQSVPISVQNALFGNSSSEQQQKLNNGSELLIPFTQTAVQREVQEVKLDLSMLDNALDCFKSFLTVLYGGVSSCASGAFSLPPGVDPSSLLFLAKLLELSDLEVSALFGKFLSSAPSLPTSLSLSSAVSSSTSSSSPSSSIYSSGSVNFRPMPNNENQLPLYLAYLQLQSLLHQQQQHFAHPMPPHLAHFAHHPQISAPFGAAPSAVGFSAPMSALLAEMFSKRAAPSVGQSTAVSDSSLPSSTAIGVHSTESGAPSSMSSSSVSMDHPLENSTESLDSITQSSAGGANNMLVPSNDKEGWCRNKKYIQIVKKGYRCLVCNKVYGRYNSVSYHVTIYHRNPPIRCEEEGCQFTTREARYIHFHKYYRHQIALPESIDLASRKCPLLGCKHVSKSPAMLDKHIHRHVADCLKDGALYVCTMPAKGGESEAEVQADEEQEQCQFRANSHETMYEHLLSVHSSGGRGIKIDEYQTTEKEKKGQQQTTIMRNHQQTPPMSASAPATPPTPNNARAFHCEECNFKGRTLVALEQHKVQKHSQRARTGTFPNITPKMSGLTAHFEPMIPQQNGGRPLNGLSLLSGVLSAASLPDSPLSPSSVGGGLFPPAFPSSLLFGTVPSPSFAQSAIVADQQQQLIAQLIAAQQKLASALLGSPPAAQQNATQTATIGEVGDSNQQKMF
ncbi:hypothetical protein niasHS_013515 [Heterodera schachtii]|uniref:C2H2-type domain-containing protein n=1 Tax=Heterodera schachtii TaxID=97005 RepID=A0ABD2I9D8_HETSC